MNEKGLELVEGSGNVFRDFRDPHADFSRIRTASLGRFTLDRLMKILATLDGRIRITVHVDPHWTETSATPSPG